MRTRRSKSSNDHYRFNIEAAFCLRMPFSFRASSFPGFHSLPYFSSLFSPRKWRKRFQDETSATAGLAVVRALFVRDQDFLESRHTGRQFSGGVSRPKDACASRLDTLKRFPEDENAARSNCSSEVIAKARGAARRLILRASRLRNCAPLLRSLSSRVRGAVTRLIQSSGRSNRRPASATLDRGHY